MTRPLADRIEQVLPELERRGPAGLAGPILESLARAVRGEPSTLVDFDLWTLRALRPKVLDALETEATAAEIRRVSEWFSEAIENRLAASTQQFAALLDAIDDRIVLLDASPEARVVYLNRATEAAALGMHGASREQMVGRSTIVGTHAPAYEAYVARLAGRARAGETVGGEFLLPLPDGAIWHEHRFHPVHAADGAVESIAVSSREIHARKLAEGRLHLLSKIAHLAESAELDDVLSRAAGFAVPELGDWSIFELVRDGAIQRSNVVHPDIAKRVDAEQRLAHSRGAPHPFPGAGARIVDLQEPSSLLRASDPALFTLLEGFAATTAIIVPFVIMGVTTALATFVFGRESGRRHTEADLAIADEVARRVAQIVENARLHAEVAQALAYRERVMGVLGHDLRNPVAAVLSLSRTLAKRPDVPERTKEGLHHIQGAAARMEQLIATVLDFSKMRFGKLALSVGAFDLGTLTRSVVDELRATHPDRDIVVDAAADLRGRWDAGRLGQVVSNLVGNALAHGAPEGRVQLKVAAERDDVVVAVVNQGQIPSGAFAKLFEPFWQGTDATRARGLGLGLWIVQQIVHAHGGQIAVRSENDETTFRVTLPR